MRQSLSVAQDALRDSSLSLCVSHHHTRNSRFNVIIFNLTLTFLLPFTLHLLLQETSLCVWVTERERVYIAFYRSTRTADDKSTRHHRLSLASLYDREVAQWLTLHFHANSNVASEMMKKWCTRFTLMLFRCFSTPPNEPVCVYVYESALHKLSACVWGREREVTQSHSHSAFASDSLLYSMWPLFSSPLSLSLSFTEWASLLFVPLLLLHSPHHLSVPFCVESRHLKVDSTHSTVHVSVYLYSTGYILFQMTLSLSLSLPSVRECVTPYVEHLKRNHSKSYAVLHDATELPVEYTNCIRDTFSTYSPFSLSLCSRLSGGKWKENAHFSPLYFPVWVSSVAACLLSLSPRATWMTASTVSCKNRKSSLTPLRSARLSLTLQLFSLSLCICSWNNTRKIVYKINLPLV